MERLIKENRMRFRVACCLLLAGPALAQFSSSVQGLVSDASGGVVPGASVTVSNVATGVNRETSTLADGFYRVLDLGPGQYRVSVSKTGFQDARQEKVTVGISEAARVDFTLQVGALGEKVTVSANVVQLETEQGRVSGRIEAQQ